MRSSGRLAMTVAVTAVVALSITTGCARAQLCPELVQIAAELDALDAEIALIQDMHTLQLSADQIRELMPAVASLRSAAVEHEQRRVEVLQRLKPLLEQQRALVLRDEPISDELSEQIAAINNQLITIDMQLDEVLLPHARIVREMLTEPQVSIITGGEEARRQVLELLEWVRELDDAAFEQEAPPLAAELAEPELGLSEEEIVDLLAIARAMTAEQYERAGEEIRGRLIELYRPSHEAADQIIVQVFLHEAMPKVLEDILAVMVEDQG